MKLTLIALASTLVLPLIAAPVKPPAKETFTLFIYETDAEVAKRTAAEGAADYWAGYGRFAESMTKAGVLRGGSALHWGPAVTSVGKAKLGKRGPHLGGYFVIEVDSRAEALRWAEQCPSAKTAAVEVVPHYAAPGM